MKSEQGEAAGRVLAGKYRLVSLLGSGGLGRVYLAEQIGLARSVAVKLLRPDRGGANLERFRNEARAASRLNHPNTISIYDFGVTDDDEPFLVMEYLRGQTLSELIAEQRLPIPRMIGIGVQLLDALDEAHSCGVVHRDLKSDNIIVQSLRGGDDLVKVIDFGLAQLDDDEPDRDMSGTPEYMAPEQVRGVDIGAGVDLYAAGVVLYEMIVGRTPFAGGQLVRTLQSQLLDTPVPPHQTIPSCPKPLSALVMRALAKTAAERFASAAEMRDALAELRTLRPVPAGKRPGTPAVAVADTVAFGAGAAAAETLTGAAPPRRRRRTLDPGIAPSGFISRRAELAKLRDVYRGVAAHGAVAITGPVGIGKARLVREVAEELASDITTFFAEPDPTGLRAPWYPVLSVLEAVFELPAALDLDELSKAIARRGLPARDLPGLAELFGLPGSLEHMELAVRRRETFAASRRALEAIHRLHPGAVLCFVDVQEYDRPSLELVQTLAAMADGTGVRVVVTTTDGDAMPLGAEVIALEPLSSEETLQLAAHLCGDGNTIPGADVLFEMSEGVPEAIEQVAGWLRRDGNPVDAPHGFADLAAARIEALPADSRRVLQAIAVHGVYLSPHVTERLMPRLEVDAERALAELVDEGFVAVSGGVTVRSPRFAELAVACTPADVLRQYHQVAFEIYDRELELAPTSVLAHHAHGAAADERAFELLMAAGADAVRRFDDDGAVRWYGRAVRVARELAAQAVDGCDEALVDASVCLADVLRYAGRYGFAASVLDEAQQLCAHAARRASVIRARARIALAERDGEAACRGLREAIGAALASGDRGFICETYLDLAKALGVRGDPAGAAAELTEGINLLTLGEGLAIPCPGVDRLWLLGLRLAELHLRAGELAEAERVVSQAMTQAGTCPHPQAGARLLSLRARIAQSADDYESARRYRAEAIDLLRSLGDRRSTAELLIANANTSLTLEPMGRGPNGNGDDGARAALEAARALAVEIGWEEGAVLAET